MRIPVGFGDVEEVGGAKDACVVDQDVDPAEGGEGGGDGGLDLGAARTSQRIGRASPPSSAASAWPAATSTSQSAASRHWRRTGGRRLRRCRLRRR
jgi:hypothetical protein